MQLVAIYAPLMKGWLGREGLPAQDCDDVVQEVLTTLNAKVREFEHNGRCGAFRAWLRAVTHNCLRTFRRSQARHRGTAGIDRVLEQFASPDSPLSQQWDREHDEHVVREALLLIRPTVDAKTWLAFEKFGREGRSAEEVAAELQITVNAVRLAKFRILERLRQLVGDLVEE